MSIKKFPLASLQKVRLYVRRSLALAPTEQEPNLVEVDEMPEPESLDDLSGIFTFGGTPLAENPPVTVQEEWFVSTVNPGAPLIKLPGLRLKADYRLVSYLFRDGDSGVGVVWGVPEALSTTAELEKALSDSRNMSMLPKPPGALPHFMEALEGDRSPASFLVASILRRELQEFGALGDRQNWSHHELIDQIESNRWTWHTNQPKDLWPKVRLLPDGQAAVEFFSCRAGQPKILYRHLDQYAADTYKPISLDKSMATMEG